MAVERSAHSGSAVSANTDGRLGSVGEKIAYVGVPIIMAGALGSSLETIGVGALTTAAGYGMTRMDEARHSKGGVPEVGSVQDVENIDDLKKPGAVEDLVRQGRITIVSDYISGKRGVPGYEEGSFLFVPPPGVSFGDKVWHFPAAGFEFFNAGESRGFTTVLNADRATAQRIRQRQNDQLELIGRKYGPYYEFISDEERAQLG